MHINFRTILIYHTEPPLSIFIKKGCQKMGSEKEGFREQLARIDKAFPDKELLSAQEVANWLGLKRETVIKYYGYAFQAVSKRRYCTKVDLASAISK